MNMAPKSTNRKSFMIVFVDVGRTGLWLCILLSEVRRVVLMRSFTSGFAIVIAVLSVFGAHEVQSETTDALQSGLAAYEAGDFLAALEYWRPLAEAGSTEAQYYLGVMYARGEGLPQDPEIAINWYRKAASLGHDKAQYNLGLAFLQGRGAERDATEAAKWISKSAAMLIEHLYFHGIPDFQTASSINYIIIHVLRQLSCLKWLILEIIGIPFGNAVCYHSDKHSSNISRNC